MKKYLAILLAMMLVLACLAGCGDKAEETTAETAAEEPAAEVAAEPAEEVVVANTYVVTFSDGTVYDLAAGEDLVFFIQCNSPGDMGAPNAGEEGAGITVSQGTVSYSDVGTGGPNSYPTSELVTVTGIADDITVTVADAATAMNAEYTLYFGDDIQAALDYANEMAAQMAENPMDDGSGSGEASGEGGGASAELDEGGDYEVEIDGKTVTAHIEFTSTTDTGKTYVITYDDVEITGALDKGVWTADDPAYQTAVEAVQAAYQGYTGAGVPTGA